MIRNKLMILLSIALLIALAGCDTPAAAVNANTAVSADTNSATLNESAVNNMGVEESTSSNQSLPAPVVEVEKADAVGEALTAAPAAAVAGQLTEAEIASLNFMREEEKLAHDVYLTLHDMWGLPIFQNISASEQNHMDSVLAVLQKYGQLDPASGNPVGVFVDPTLQNLYDQMVSQGSQSLLEALRVGATIEEVDIIDLDTRLTQTANADIQLTYENLLSGSENHLRSFVSTLERQTGETYAPQYLTDDTYAAIMSGETGRNNNGMAGADGGQGQGTGGNWQSGQNGQGGNGNGYRGGRGTASNGQGVAGQP